MPLDVDGPVVRDFWIGFLAQCGATLLGIVLVFGYVLLVGCAAGQSVREKVEVVEVKTLVTVPCVERAPDLPVYRWGVGALPATDKAKVAILLADYEDARQYGSAWEAATVGCVKLAP